MKKYIWKIALAITLIVAIVAMFFPLQGGNTYGTLPTPAKSVGTTGLTSGKIPVANATTRVTDGPSYSNGNFTTTGNLTSGGLTSGRVPYVTTGGKLVDSSSFTYNGTALTAPAFLGDGSGLTGISGNITGPTGGTANFVVASQNATTTERARADCIFTLLVGKYPSSFNLTQPILGSLI